MRGDVSEALDAALMENHRYDAGRSGQERINHDVAPARRRTFIRRVRAFLENCPDDLSIEELRDEFRE